jgi:hypothetical protein
MTYVRIDDHFPQHRKLLALDDASFALYVRAICYSSTQLSDGEIPLNALSLLTRNRRPQTLVDRLLSADLWESTLTGWRIHDYLDWQESAESVLTKRAAARERMQRLRSQDVRANNQRSSHEVREQETEVETKTYKNPPSVGSRDDGPPPFHSAQKRARPIPKNFAPSADMLAWAAKQRPNVDVRDRTLTFINHALATGRELVEWEPAWKNWILDSEKHGQTKPNGNGSNGHGPEPMTNRSRGWDRSRETYEQYQARTQADV